MLSPLYLTLTTQVAKDYPHDTDGQTEATGVSDLSKP